MEYLGSPHGRQDVRAINGLFGVTYLVGVRGIRVFNGVVGAS